MGQTTNYVYAALAFTAILVGLYGTSEVIPNADYLLANVKQSLPDDPPGGSGKK